MVIYMLEELKRRIDNFDGIHIFIKDKDKYIDELYINSIDINNIELYYDKKTYMYNSFDLLINDKIFNGKSILDIKDNLYLDGDIYE